MHSPRHLALLGLALPALALASCGSSSDSGLSKTKLAAKANAICANYNKQAKALKQPSNINDPAQAAAYFQAAHDLAKKQSDEFGSLKPASDVKTQWNTFIAAYDAGTAYLQQLADAATAKDATKGQTLVAGFPAVSNKVNTAADAFGATTCGSKSG